MDRIRRLLVRHSHRFKQSPVKTTKSSSPDNAPPILTLPNEILYQILASLALHDEFVLSHTCRGLRSLTQRDWTLAVISLPRNAKLAFWTGLAYTKPNHWVCGSCCKLHRLALKLTRMGGKRNKNQQRLLEKIMAPFTSRVPQPRGIHLTSTSSGCAVTPKTVGGRFLVHVEHDFRHSREIALVRSGFFRRVCPHLMVMLEDPRQHFVFHDNDVNVNDGSRSQTRDVRVYFGTMYVPGGCLVAVDGHGYETIGHCERCVMDYTILASFGVVTVHSWHDLGAYGSPESEEWMVHVMMSGNTYSRGPTVYHELGSVRKMYLEG
ncbi:hypothetical protein BDP81DRAFT_390653 [Colletotrichum phormii]|uniref:F-box domain-containing protein n=1 Tax=Colletotrichum phormii TaxID=359342 RepID=A0AAJ0A013_9PEZI|nr:uncharacterized protein BDP81DRAFT_390653 [Colletotrichum phormii]KAK1641390.1 hypothetical protein BDP81DRAFT_390653 [Colletotrichum phormii]